MAFQPILDLAARRVFAYEALARGPNGEPVPSLLGQLTPENRYAFDQSARRRAIELAGRLGVAERGAAVSINFIPSAMYRPEACVRVTLAAAARAGFPQDRIIFEVTEGERVDDPEHLAAIFREYKRQRFLSAIDDFGAGYAGLNLLADFQPDIVKLDMHLIRGIDSRPPRRIVVHAVLTACRELGIRAIAEGVETEAEAATLRELGVTLFQGYLFARPAFEALPDVRF